MNNNGNVGPTIGPSTETLETTDIEVSSQEVNDSNNGGMNKPPKKKSVLPLLIIIILLVGGAAFGGYYVGAHVLTKNNNQEKKESNDNKTSEDNKSSDEKKDDEKKELLNSKGIKVELDKNGEVFLTYTEVDAENKSIVSNVKTYLLVQAGQSDVCEGNKRLLFVLNDGTVSSLNIDSLVCGKKLVVDNKLANLNNVVAIRDSLENSGVNEPENHYIYAQTSDSKEYNITKVLTGESKTAELKTNDNQTNNSETNDVKSYASGNMKNIITNMGYKIVDLKSIYSTGEDATFSALPVKNGEKTLYLCSSIVLATSESACGGRNDLVMGKTDVYYVNGYYILVHGQTGSGSATIYDSNLSKVTSFGYIPDSGLNLVLTDNIIFYGNSLCKGKRSDGTTGRVLEVHKFDTTTKADNVVFTVDEGNAGAQC